MNALGSVLVIGMVDRVTMMNSRAKAFATRLRTDHCSAPEARDVLHAESDLGTGAIGFQLSNKGSRLLFRALDLERKAKIRAKIHTEKR